MEYLNHWPPCLGAKVIRAKDSSSCLVCQVPDSSPEVTFQNCRVVAASCLLLFYFSGTFGSTMEGSGSDVLDKGIKLAVIPQT
jgi:hypothetical protein